MKLKYHLYYFNKIIEQNQLT